MRRVRAWCVVGLVVSAMGGSALGAAENCADATPVGEGVFAYDTSRAGDDGPNPCSSVGFKTVWLAYTASAAGTVTVSTCGTTFDEDDQQSVVAVYSGSCGSPVNIACSFSGCGLGSSATFAAAAGQTYLVQIGGGCEECTSSGVVAIVSDATPPANDGCAAARVIAEGVHTVTNVGATDDGSASCGSSVADVWFSYTPASSGLAVVSACGSAFDTVLSVHEGGTCAPLGTELACSDDECRAQSEVQVGVTAGQTYLIRLAGSAAAARDPIRGVGRLSVRVLNPPVNDECAAATAVGEGVFGLTNVDARTDGPQDCEDAFGDVWFVYTPSVTGLARVTAGGWDTIVAAYVGGCDGLTQIACNNDYASVAATAHFAVQAGQPVLLLVAGNGGATGSGALTISADAAPANDACAAAQVIGPGSLPFSTRGATTDGPVPACPLPTDQIHSDLWYAFTAPMAGDVLIGTCGSLFDTLLAVYDGTGACPDGAQAELVCDDDSCADLGPSVVAVRGVPAGQRLLIRVGGFAGGVGEGVLSVSTLPGPCELQPGDGAILEAEGCGGSSNGGCAVDGDPVFETLACAPSQTIFGSAFVNGGVRDTDWYRVTLPFAATITWGGRAEFPATFSIRNGVCQGDELARAMVRTPCEGRAVASIRVPAGTYNLTVVPSDFWSGPVCGELSDYLATLSVVCEATGRCCVGGACDVRTSAECVAAGGSYLGDNAACDTTSYLAAPCDTPFESIDLTGQPGPQCDACQLDVPLGFEFTFYGRVYSRVWISANGFLSFGPSGRQGDRPHPIPRNWNPNAVIAPWWTDLFTGFEGSVRYQTLGAAGSRRFIAQWTRVPRAFEADENTFQAVLHEADGSIVFRYDTVSPSPFVDQTVIGVENADGTRATAFDAMSPLSGTCLRFTPAVGGPACPACVADFNDSGGVTVQDIFDFLAAYFSMDPRADVNGSGGLSVQDIFDFLAAYFGGC